MRSDRFYKNQFLPFAELRSSLSSRAPFKPHLHQALSIGAVHEGEVRYNVNGQEAILAPGSLVVINPETLHACNPSNETGRSYYMLHLDTDWCLRVQQSMWEVGQFAKAEKVRIDDKLLYQQYCKAMAHLMDEKIHLQEKEQLVFDLVCAVFAVACSPRTKKRAPSKNIAELKKLLSSDLQKDFTLNSLAAELGVNPYTLIRSFKAAAGVTPHAYRMNCRIEYARALLRQGEDIAQTALECGFFDQSHFHRYFKAMTTVTPQAYRVNFVQ
jgi:AraC-like DNA-binding protein